MRRVALILAAVWLGGAACAEEDRLARNLEIVFDTSGSMQGKKIGQAKRALTTFLGTVPAGTHVGLIVFSDGAPRRVLPLAPIDRGRMLTTVQQLGADGGTPIADSLEIAARSLREQRERQGGYGSYSIVVVTDGDETVRRSALADVVESIQRDGITLDVIGFDLESDHSLKSQVARYRSAQDEAELTQAMLDSLAETESYEEVSRFQATEQGEPPRRQRERPTRGREAGPASAVAASLCGLCSATFLIGLFGTVGYVMNRRKR